MFGSGGLETLESFYILCRFLSNFSIALIVLVSSPCSRPREFVSGENYQI